MKMSADKKRHLEKKEKEISTRRERIGRQSNIKTRGVGKERDGAGIMK